ncbi:MAG TPA: hypothetical protein VFK22_09390 [Candidatus Dormibacteraeota bacterium]|nr:hypothetical protein [Candidatus Dormibacteraeota bacterium]
MRYALTALIALVLAACSSSSQPEFTLSGASVDPTYFCPGGANNAPYDLHATVRVHNSTGKAVTIESATAQMTVASIKGVWLEKVGDRYEAANARFTPITIAPGGNTTLDLTIPSACTSGKYGTGTSSSAEYNVSIHLTTSAGSFAVTAGNQHEIVAD